MDVKTIYIRCNAEGEIDFSKFDGVEVMVVLTDEANQALAKYMFNHKQLKTNETISYKAGRVRITFFVNSTQIIPSMTYEFSASNFVSDDKTEIL